MRRLALCVSALALALLAGCRTAPPVAGDPNRPWGEQRVALASLEHFQLQGRVAVAAGDQGFTASLRYEQQKRGADLALDGPLGIGGLRVNVREDSVALETSRGEKLAGPAARESLEARLGFALPLAQLRWWLLGLPAPDSPFTEMSGADGFTQSFEQQGWKVTIPSRAPALGFQLPKRLNAEREGARLKLVVERWRP